MECNRVEILDVKTVTKHYYLLTLMAPQVARGISPGQFVQVRVDDRLDPLLRRPFSVYHWDEKQGIIEILFQVRGKGTALLARKRPGERLDILGPLGRGFAIPAEPGAALLVGGGIGAAPLRGLAEKLEQSGWELTVLLGAADESLLARTEDFSHLGKTIIATDDGSRGIKGRVTNVLPLVAGSTFKQIYACGPKPMLAALSSWAAANGLPIQVSLDEVIACGMGVCLGCAHPVKAGAETGYAKVCTQGPVFNGEEVVWDEKD